MKQAGSARRDFILLKFCLETDTATGNHPVDFQIGVTGIAYDKIMEDFRTVCNGAKIKSRLFDQDLWGG